MHKYALSCKQSDAEILTAVTTYHIKYRVTQKTAQLNVFAISYLIKQRNKQR